MLHAHHLLAVCAGLQGVSALVLQQDKQAPTIECGNRPKVFVYELNGPCADQKGELTEELAFGKAAPKSYSDEHTHGQWFRKTSEDGMGQLFHYRLLHSKCRTMNPKDADLFFVPALTAVKSQKALKMACRACKKADLTSQLQHLNEQTAKRHIFMISKEHFGGRECQGWWAHPTGLLAQSIRLAHSPILPSSPEFHDDVKYMKKQYMGKWGYDKEFFDANMYPNLHSLPWPSTIHFAKEIPWNVGQRKTTMLFVGSDQHGDIEVRKRISHQCKKTSACKWRQFNNIAFSSGKWDWTSAIAKKQEATFCLEPAGDTPFRRSITDSVLMGCIPVFFNRATERTSDLIWGDWLGEAHIQVPRHSFVKGKIDLKSFLKAIPNEKIAKMQSALRANARRFQISLEDDPEDLISTVLKRLANHSLSS